MTSIEETGKTIEEATDRALEQLGVTEDEVDVEILEEGARGFLGLGQSPARVKVTLKQRKPAPEAAPTPRPRPERRERPARPKPAPRAEAPKQAPRAEAPKPRPAAPAPRAEKPAPKPAPAPAPPAAEVPAVPTGEALQAAAKIGAEVLQRIADGIEPGARSVVKNASDNQIVLEITASDPATIIGQHGRTIDAIQYLVGVITNKQLPEKVRVVVDVEGYRSRREEALREQAFLLASKVKESGQEAVLEPLHANERRIIHTALADDPDIYTYSEGMEPERYVVISPKK